MTSTPPRPHELPVLEPGRPDSPWIHPPSGVRFVRGWERVQPVACLRYDDEGLDVSVRYGLLGSMTVTAYVFPLAGPSVEAACQVAFVNAVRDMLQSLDDPRAGEECDVAYANPGQPALRGRLVRAVGTPRAPHASRSTAIVQMFSVAGWALKLRSTATLRRSDLAEEFFEQWLRTATAPASS